MSDHWGSYLTRIENDLASVLLDLDVGSELEALSTPYLILVKITLKSPNADGLSSDEEFDELCVVDDVVEDVCQQHQPCFEVGRITSNGERIFFVYVDSQARAEEFKKDLMQKGGKYEFRIAIRSEPDCAGYFEYLYPSPEEMQSIQNQRLIQRLLEHGDDLNQPRPVDHWIYFVSKANRDLFKQRLADQSVDEIQESEYEEGDLWYGLNVVKTSAVDPVTIDEIVLTFFRLAQECEGDYDGWETPVVKK